MTAIMPPVRSPTGTDSRTGGPPASPFVLRTPLIAWVITSYAIRSRNGPVCPKPEMEQTISAGFNAASSASPKPSRARVPGRKFSISTSALRQRPARTCLPSCWLKSSARLRLLRLTERK